MSKLSRSLVQKKNLSLIWPAVFKFGYLFYSRVRVPLLTLNELEEKSQATIILDKFDSRNKNNISNHLQWLRNSSDLYSAKYEKIILTEDFNVSPEESHMKTFEFMG